MTFVTKILVKLGILKEDLDYHFVRASMVIIFLFFGYQKWFGYEAQALIPYISNGPLIFWMYPVFGIRGATYFLGAAQWLFGALLFFRLLEQKIGNPRSARLMLFLCRHGHDYPVYAGRLGCVCRRVPRYD